MSYNGQAGQLPCGLRGSWKRARGLTSAWQLLVIARHLLLLLLILNRMYR